MRKIIKVIPQNFALRCEMDNGEIFLYDMSFVNSESSPMIDPLKDINHFKKVFIELGSLSWPSGYEIHAETICREGKIINSSKDSSI